MTGFCDGDVVRDSEGGTGLEGRDCALGHWRLGGTLAATGLKSGRDGALSGEFGLDFLADRLAGD